MAKKSTKEKKLRRKKHQEEAVKQENIQFDIIELLRDQPLTTKPEVGDFLKKYVKTIRILVEHSKITIYPVNDYTISKVFINFLDNHQLIVDFQKQPREYYLFEDVSEITINEKELHYITNFVQKLQEFQFIH